MFIVVCNNTATSKLVHDWIAGYERPNPTPDDPSATVLVPGKLALFSNVEDAGPGERRMAARPVTILVDSEELESGDALSDASARSPHPRSTVSSAICAPAGATRRRTSSTMPPCCAR